MGQLLPNPAWPDKGGKAPKPDVAVKLDQRQNLTQRSYRL
jgi:hypothetical protein